MAMVCISGRMVAGTKATGSMVAKHIISRFPKTRLSPSSGRSRSMTMKPVALSIPGFSQIGLLATISSRMPMALLIFTSVPGFLLENQRAIGSRRCLAKVGFPTFDSTDRLKPTLIVRGCCQTSNGSSNLRFVFTQLRR